MPRLLSAGWALERATGASTSVSAADLRALSRKVHDVDLTRVTEPYAEVVFKVRDLGVAISDRRAVKMLKLLAASALLSGRNAANPSDLWVLRYVWDRAEQIDPLAALINGVLDRHRDEPAAHPLAAVPEAVNPEELARQLELAEKGTWNEARSRSSSLPGSASTSEGSPIGPPGSATTSPASICSKGSPGSSRRSAAEPGTWESQRIPGKVLVDCSAN